MSHIAIDYLYCTIQIAFIVLAVYFLRLFIPQKDVRTRAFTLTFGSLLIAALTVFTFMGGASLVAGVSHGLVKAIAGDSSSQQSHDTYLSTALDEMDESPQSGVRVGIATLDGWVRQSMTQTTQAGATRRKRSVLAGMWVACLCIGVSLARLAAGMVWWHRLVVRSRPVNSTNVNALALRLKTDLSLAQPIRILENRTIPTAATVGIVRSTIVLSTDWPKWSDSELRSVLAHEFAHIKRRDYLSRVLAEACTAVHLFNPLVHAIRHSLNMAQESCADALAANVTGNQKRYVESLASLALRQDDRLARVPALCFLPARSKNLMRRIKMLTAKEGTTHSRTARLRCAMASIVLGIFAACVATVIVADDLESSESVETQVANEAPFNLAYVDARSDGIMAIRCGRILKRPEFREVIRLQTKLLEKAIVGYGGDPSLAFGCDELDQIVGPITLSHDPDKKEKKNSIMLAFSFARTKHAYDWTGLVKTVSPGSAITSVGGVTRLKDVSIPALFPKTEMDVVDSQSIGCRASMRNGKRLSVGPGLEPMSEATPIQEEWPDGWKHVADSDVAVMFNNRERSWHRALQEHSNGLTELFEKAAMGIRFEQMLRIELAVGCKDDESADEFEARIRGMLHKWCDASVVAVKKETAGTVRVRQVLNEMVREMKISRHDDTVFLELNPKFSSRELLALAAKFMAAEFKQTPEIVASQNKESQQR